MTVPNQLTALNAGTTPWYGVSGVQGTYLGIINQLNNTIGQITGALNEYGQVSLTQVYQLHPTIIQMQSYVQSVAMTGVDPSEIGTENQIVTISPGGNGFLGRNFPEIDPVSSIKRKKLAKLNTIFHLQSTGIPTL